MSTVRRIQFTAEISAPPATVYGHMTGDASYRDWTSAFVEGSHFKGSWQPGERMRFLAPNEDGMVAEIAENRPNEFISIRHLGFIYAGVEDTTSDAVRAWAPAYENYTFSPMSGGTRLVIDQDITPEYEAYMLETWPRALQRLKALCEGTSGS